MAEQKESTQLGLHILVAEDNQMNQLVASKLLKKLGCTFQIANDGIECLEYLARQPYDLVLMDCMMPNMDGFEAASKIRASDESYANIPIIAFTASTLVEDLKACLDSGMNGYLDKPVNRDRMTEVLSEWAKQIKS